MSKLDSTALIDVSQLVLPSYPPLAVGRDERLKPMRTWNIGRMQVKFTFHFEQNSRLGRYLRFGNERLKGEKLIPSAFL